LISLRPGDHAVRLSNELEPDTLGVGHETRDCLTPELRVADYAAFAHLVLSDLKLGFDESQDLPPRFEQRVGGGKELFETNE
jgi:hypothetical protein